MRTRKIRKHRPLRALRRRRDDQAETLSQIVHLTLRGRFEPDANFDKQRRPIACAPIS
jgi:hypothetical protein